MAHILHPRQLTISGNLEEIKQAFHHTGSPKYLLKYYLSKVKHDETIDVDLLAGVTRGMTSKDIKGLI